MRSTTILGCSSLAACGAIGIEVAAPAQLAGDVAAPFSLPSTQGTVSLGDVLARGAAVLVFYRGHW